MVYAQKKPMIYQARVPLLNKRKEIVPEAKAIFETWFERFSNEEGVMTPETCVNFIRDSTNDVTVSMTDNRIVALFNNYDQDIDGKLTKEEFLTFYKDRAMSKPELVWSNLNSHGIGNDLRPIASQYQTDDPNELKNPCVLPRFKLSSNDHDFMRLFGILG